MYTTIEVSNAPMVTKWHKYPLTDLREAALRPCCDSEEGGYHHEGCPRLAEIRKEYPHAQSVESMTIAKKLFPWWNKERQEG